MAHESNSHDSHLDSVGRASKRERSGLALAVASVLCGAVSFPWTFFTAMMFVGPHFRNSSTDESLRAELEQAAVSVIPGLLAVVLGISGVRSARTRIARLLSRVGFWLGIAWSAYCYWWIIDSFRMG